MDLESRSIRLLATLVEDMTTVVEPDHFAAMLYLRNQGYLEVVIEHGGIVAKRTPRGTDYLAMAQAMIVR